MLSSFLLIGQSNMSGRGVLTADNRIFDNRIFRLVNGRWQPMWEPLSADRVFAGASLAPAFALEFVKRTGEQVGLIPASDGGSSIDEWQPGEALYDHAVCQARLAMRISDIKAVLWHQGESDCNPARAAAYAPKFLHMFRTLKKDLQLPEIRIYVGGLGDYLSRCEFDPNLAHYDGINTVLRTLAAENDDIRYVSAEGLAPKDDNLHFNTESLREFGKRYFAAFAADTSALSMAAKTEASEASAEQKLSEMKAKKERGEISDTEYDAFVHAYIAKL